MPPINSETCKLTLNGFKLESDTILNELTVYHETKKRLIEHTFTKLFDNLPASIKDLPINQCMADYACILKELHAKQTTSEDEHQVVEESIFTGDEEMEENSHRNRGY